MCVCVCVKLTGSASPASGSMLVCCVDASIVYRACDREVCVRGGKQEEIASGNQICREYIEGARSFLQQWQLIARKE